MKTNLNAFAQNRSNENLFSNGLRPYSNRKWKSQLWDDPEISIIATPNLEHSLNPTADCQRNPFLVRNKSPAGGCRLTLPRTHWGHSVGLVKIGFIEVVLLVLLIFLCLVLASCCTEGEKRVIHGISHTYRRQHYQKTYPVICDDQIRSDLGILSCPRCHQWKKSNV